MGAASVARVAPRDRSTPGDRGPGTHAGLPARPAQPLPDCRAFGSDHPRAADGGQLLVAHLRRMVRRAGVRRTARSSDSANAARPGEAGARGRDCYLRLIELRSQAAFAWLSTGFTFDARTRYGLSHIHGIAAGLAVVFFLLSAPGLG